VRRSGHRRVRGCGWRLTLPARLFHLALFLAALRTRTLATGLARLLRGPCLVARAEALGFESAWTQEQILGHGTPFLDSIAMLSFAAACTERLRLGCAVFVTPLHNPLHLAKSLSTLDQVSRGRLEERRLLRRHALDQRRVLAPTHVRARLQRAIEAGDLGEERARLAATMAPPDQRGDGPRQEQSREKHLYTGTHDIHGSSPRIGPCRAWWPNAIRL